MSTHQPCLRVWGYCAPSQRVFASLCDGVVVLRTFVNDPVENAGFDALSQDVMLRARGAGRRGSSALAQHSTAPQQPDGQAQCGGTNERCGTCIDACFSKPAKTCRIT